MMSNGFGELMHILRTDPDIVIPRQRCYELTGVYWGFNLDEFASLEQFKKFLRDKVAEAEKERGLAPGQPLDATAAEQGDCS